MAASTRDRARRSRDTLAEFTGCFLRSVTSPSETRPTVRCLSRTDAVGLAVQARDEIASPELNTFSGAALLDLLEKSGVIQAVPIVTPPKRRDAMYVVGSQLIGTLEPLELLQAAEPSGLVCYFTAVAYYGLTTQIPTHHHIARLNARSIAPPRAGPRKPTSQNLSTPRRNRLGTLLFTYQSVSYYHTSRGAHTVAGIQLRQLNDRSLVRITTREQTLLDTLHRPISCGGSSVVWEAWQTGLSDLDESRLCDHLINLADSKYPRRVGYLLSNLGYTPGPRLKALLDEARDGVQADSETAIVPLFPGLPAVSVDTTWRLELPIP